MKKKTQIFCLFLLSFWGSSLLAQEIQTTSLTQDFSQQNKENFLQSIQKTRDGNVESILSKVTTVPLEKVEPFLAFNMQIFFSEKSKNTKIFLRTSQNGDQWNNWEEVFEDDNMEIVDSKFVGDLLFFDKEIKYLQYKILNTIKENGKMPSISEAKLSFISPGATVGELSKVSFNDGKGKGLPQTTVEAYPRPSYVNRVGWNCPQAENVSTRETTAVTHLVIHHSAANTTSTDFAAVVRSYWSYHVNTLSWADIGYNWLVDPNGVLYKGRAWKSTTEENIKGAHNSGYNSNCLGLSFIGNYEDNEPSTVGIEMLIDMSAFLCDKFGIDPVASSYHAAIGIVNDNITGHKDSGGGTSCPGVNIISKYSQIRQGVYDKLNPAAPVTIDDFEVSVGHFDKVPTYSGSTTGISSNSTSERTTAEAYNSNASLKLVLTDNTSSSSDWGVRLLSGTGSPANNIEIGSTFYVGYWLKTSSATRYGKVSIWIDDSDGIEVGKSLDVINDGDWHLYLWNLADNSEWEAVTGNGTIDASSVTIDALYFAAPNASLDWTIYIDDVKTDDAFVDENSLFVVDNFETSVDHFDKYPTYSGSTVGILSSSSASQTTSTSYSGSGSLEVVLIDNSSSSSNWAVRLLSGSGNPANNVPINARSVGYWLKTSSASSSATVSIWIDDSDGIEKGAPISVINDGNWNLYMWDLSDDSQWTLVTGNGYVEASSVTIDGLFFTAPNASPDWTLFIDDVNYDYFSSSAYPASSGQDEVTTVEYDGFNLEKTVLKQNYPNPFNPTTNISFYLAEETQVKITVFNIRGEKVVELVNEFRDKGNHIVNFDGSQLASGLYIYRIETPNYNQNMKMMLMK